MAASRDRTHLDVWLQTGETVDDLADLKSIILALANAAGMWWADYDYAVPIVDWIAAHGAAPGVRPRRNGWAPWPVE